jgi:hypothetical protein
MTHPQVTRAELDLATSIIIRYDPNPSYIGTDKHPVGTYDVAQMLADYRVRLLDDYTRANPR